MFSALFDNRIYNFEHAFGVKDITTSEMKEAIRDWYKLYYMAKSTKEEDPCQRIPTTVVSKLTKTAFSEYTATTGEGVNKETFLRAILGALDHIRKKAMQQALIGGECFLKPIFTSSGPCFGVVERRNFLVLGRNEQEEITDLGTAERTVVGNRYYTLLERRSIDYQGYLTIESRLFQSSSSDVLGVEIPLGKLDKYAALKPVNRLPIPVHSLGLISLRTPLENCVDGSPDAVSIYAPAAGLIHLINVNESQINGEFERGKSRLVVSADLLHYGPDGKRQITDELFTALDDDVDNVGITIFSPAFREQSFLARKQEYLRNVESLIGLKRGLLSEVEAVERTAKEITSSEGDYSLSIIDLQQAWETMVREAVRVCDLLGQMYHVCDSTSIDSDQDISIDWGNGVLYDESKTWSDYMAMVSAGMLKPEIALAWKFNLPWQTQKDLAAIREQYLPDLEALTGGD